MVRLQKKRSQEDADISVIDAGISAYTDCMQQSTADKPVLYSMYSNNVHR